MIDWDKPIMWSTGEYAFLSGERPSRSIKHVSACSRWTKHTDEAFVHVDALTGVILGFSEWDYPYIENPPASVAPDAHTDSSVSGDRERR